jgi:hypothetical protein
MLLNAYYSADISAFTNAENETILGALAANSTFSVETAQRNAWVEQIDVLKTSLQDINGWILLEFIVPRIGTRIDVVLLIGPIIFVVEFKVGETHINRTDLNQVWDYALDLKNFHQGSHHSPIVPILIATNYAHPDSALGVPYRDNVFPPVRSNSANLGLIIRAALKDLSGVEIEYKVWIGAPYRPTPTIIEAAQALYSQHSVEAISRHDAGARNLEITSQRIDSLVENARENRRKIIIFVTGVPGAGKTLVGLNVATKKSNPDQPSHAVFLSGNGPLVSVLREALTRDEVARLRGRSVKTRKGVVAQKVKAFIQNVHHFRDEGLRNDKPPADHVVIFDEAQRAWNRSMTSNFMRQKRGRPDFSQSEPEFLISYLDRHDDWAVVVCLVGGGQEINRGEAGISAWFEAIKSNFSAWDVFVSPDITESEYSAGHALESLAGRDNVFKDNGLHLAVSMRSFRAENVSNFVKAVLDCEGEKARSILGGMLSRYPIAITRDLDVAKNWIRKHARGSERYGLVASSGAMRLKPHAIDVRVDIDPIHWFLNAAGDTRSSFYMEDAATEFQVQGLELDWVCMTWDADLRYDESGWIYHSFIGARWTSVKKEDRQQYLRNAYRVLLTRARQGMVIFVPNGDDNDATRLSKFYNSTFDYLAEIGIPVLQ